jgi:hypothetical protein
MLVRGMLCKKIDLLVDDLMGVLCGWKFVVALRAFTYDAFDPWINFARPSSLSTSGIRYPRMNPLPHFEMPMSQKSRLGTNFIEVGLGNSRCHNVLAWRRSHLEMAPSFARSMGFCSFEWKQTKMLPKILLFI